MPTARADLLSRSSRRPRAARRGQVLPIFAIVVGLILLFSSLLIDGTFAFQTFRDLDTIAYHAARAGANVVAQTGPNRHCTANPGQNCTLGGGAAGQAQAWAASWAAQDGLVLKVNSATVSGDTITVHLRVCYTFQIPLPVVSSPACPGTWQVDSIQTARSLVGP